MAPLHTFNEIMGPISGMLLVWILLKLTRVETKVSQIEKHEEQLKDHEKRLNMAEPKIKRAHERCDEHRDKIVSLDKKGIS